MKPDPDRKEAYIEAAFAILIYAASFLTMVAFIWAATKIFG